MQNKKQNRLLYGLLAVLAVGVVAAATFLTPNADVFQGNINPNLSTPYLYYPGNNAVLTNYPRTAPIEVTPVDGATSYEFEITCDWCSTLEQKWANPISFISESEFFNSPPLSGDNEFRVRARAIDADGTISAWTGYTYFKYKTGPNAVYSPGSNFVLSENGCNFAISLVNQGVQSSPYTVEKVIRYCEEEFPEIYATLGKIITVDRNICIQAAQYRDQGTLTANGYDIYAGACSYNYPIEWGTEISWNECQTMQSWLKQDVLTATLNGDLTKTKQCNTIYPNSFWPSESVCEQTRTYYDQSTLTANGYQYAAGICEFTFPEVWNKEMTGTPEMIVNEYLCERMAIQRAQGVITSNGNQEEAAQCEKDYREIWNTVPTFQECKTYQSHYNEGTFTPAVSQNDHWRVELCREYHADLMNLPTVDEALCQRMAVQESEGTVTANGNLDNAAACYQFHNSIWSFEPSANACQVYKDHYDEGTFTPEVSKSDYWIVEMCRELHADIMNTPQIGEPAVKATFIDVPVTNGFFDAVEYLSALGVIEGYRYSNGNLTGYFGPNDTVTREQASKILVNGFNIAIDTTNGPTFPDVPVSRWSYDFIESLAAVNAVEGYATGDFRPNNNVTRAALVKMTVLASGLYNEGDEIDVQESTCPYVNEFERAWFAPYFQVAKENGIINSANCRPGDSASRGEASQMVYNYLSQQ
ncbi:hypothetical protein GF340_01775 [Candidatus Peregrinibacteria bacterium]|nr:hypothetical protein [Candidatus Peregrinibacteria bacterium]